MEENVHVKRNFDVYTSENEIADHEKNFNMQKYKFQTIHSMIETVGTKNKIADVGCLTGIGSVKYKELSGVDEVHVFDASEQLLVHAEKKGLVPHQWICGDQDSPVEDDLFDLVVASDIIEHIVDTKYFVSELMRMTKPGGHLLITMPNLGWWLNRLRLMCGKVPVSFPGVSSEFKQDVMIDLNHIRINLTNEWAAFFEHLGLKIELVKGYRLNMGLRFLPRQIDAMIEKPSLTFGCCFLMRVV